MSFRSFLQRCLGKLFKLRQVSTSSPVAWATSNSLSRDKPPPEACKYCMVNGDDTRWPRPPSEVEVIFYFYFFGTLTLWRHHFFHLDEKADICFDGKWKIWGRAVRLQPGRGGFSRTTKYQLFEQVDRWLARVGKGRQGGAAVVVAGGAAGVHGAEGVRRPRRSTSWLRSRSYAAAAAEVLCAAAPSAACCCGCWECLDSGAGTGRTRLPA